MRNRELETQKYSRRRTRRAKQTANKGKPSANIDMVFILLVEFRAPSKYRHGRSDGKNMMKKNMSVGVRKKGTKENKLSYIGIVLASDTIRMKD